jgi:uncharacterized protein with LGFP repeats
MPLRRRAVALVAALGVLLSISIAAPASAAPSASAQGRAYALSGSSFDAGYIIDDANFYQRSAMTQAQIQAFLSSKVTCANSNCLPNLYAKTEARANDRNICLGYTPDSDAKETAATIIYKVQQSCGISARVLLVTLQKEQGLITKSAPTTGQLNAAMGYLCPDTAPCSGQAAGFVRQIYGAAWQMRRYSFPDLWGTYHVGTYSIAYSTSSSCGRKSVKIRNNATAALYNYTPYTPNAGALANLRGTAPCGSYGNRNFWVYYNDWFGSPLAGAASVVADATVDIGVKYEQLGGETGILGAATGVVACTKGFNVCTQTYANGIMGWSRDGGAHPVTGAIYAEYSLSGGRNGTWGVPVSDENPITGANGDGSGQNFEYMQALTSAAGTFAVPNQVRSVYGDLGWVREGVGWPTAKAVCRSTALCAQQFQHAILGYYGTDSYAVTGDFYDRYQTVGGLTGSWGLPTSGQNPISGAATPGSGQNFEKVQVLSSAAGTFAVASGFVSTYGAAGWVRGSLGWPTDDTACATSTRCIQEFQGGVLARNGSTTYQVTGAVGEMYVASGGASGPLGYPTSGLNPISGTAGSGQNFEHGQALQSAAGAYWVTPAMLAAYKTFGWVRGSLGYPVAAATCTSGTCSQNFANGTLALPPSRAPYVIAAGPVGELYLAQGGPSGPLGYPTSGLNPISGTAGSGQNFQNGQVLLSSAGAFALSKKMLAAYKTFGWVRGTLGYPVGAESCSAGTCTQEFENGKVVIPTGHPAYMVANGPVGDLYLASGGPTGPLGYPTSGLNPISGTSGSGQNFQNGQILLSSAGAFSLSKTMLAAYKTFGWVRGSLGYPVAAGSCTGGTCSQQFEHGTLVVPPGGPARVE